MPPSSEQNGASCGFDAAARAAAASYCAFWRAAASLPGRAGGANQSQTVASSLPCTKSARHAIRTASLRASPRPTFVGAPQSSGRNFGTDVPSTGGGGGSPVIELVLPSTPMFEYQQLPVLVANSSHQKSTPLGSTRPSGARPMPLL